MIANAQLSVVNVLTFIHALLSGFRWELFLLDPMVFLLWGFVAVSLLFWGRGVFCGWLCPFGALQELLNTLAQRLGVKQIEVPFGLHERLWMIKYVAFLGILAISLNSIMAAFGLPRSSRSRPRSRSSSCAIGRSFSMPVALLVAGLFVERFFCRYLCPLGAALAIPARMRMFDWLKRYRECGSECQICARRCTVQAIHPLGQINPNECIYCLKCQANYFDHSVCLHLKKRAERRKPARQPPAAAGRAAGRQPMSARRLNRRRVLSILAAAAGSALVGGSVARRGADFAWRGIAMGADAQILFSGVEAEAARATIAMAVAEIERLEHALSLFREDSEICRLNRDGRPDRAERRHAARAGARARGCGGERRPVRPDRTGAVGGACRLVQRQA